MSSTAMAQFSTPQYLPFKMVNTAADPFRYFVDDRTAMPGGLNVSEVQRASDSAWKTWSDVACSAPKSVAGGFTGSTVPNPSDPYDAFNVTPVWVLSEDDPYHRPFFGSSAVKAVALPLSYAGVLVTCDIYLNGVGVNWSVTPTTAPGSVDLQTVMLHETGHCLGLNHWHPEYPAEGVMGGAVQEGVQRRSIGSPDMMALCERNPAEGGVGSPCQTDGGCGVTANGLKCVTQQLTSGSAKFCTVGCALGTGFVCPLPLSCQASTLFNPSFDGACLRSVNTVTRVGAPCAADNQCGSANGRCQPEDAHPSGFIRWNQGYCHQTCAAGQPVCPAGSQCTNIGFQNPMCLRTCRVGLADCRPGYSCAQSLGVGVCIPSCYQDRDCTDTTNFQCRSCDGLCVARQNSSGQVGDLCQEDSECGAGQSCTRTDALNPVKLCTLPCGAGCGICPAGSGCHPIAPDNAPSCLRSCTGVGTCPTGTRCFSLPTGFACKPPCATNAQCPRGQDCVSGDCVSPGEDDGGCGVFCPANDAGAPIVQPKKDAGTGATGGSGGCGCSTSGDFTGLLALVLVGLMRQRR